MRFFSSDVVDMLERAGWESGRHVAIDDLTGSLRSFGFAVSEAAIDFLTEFAFIRLEHEPSIVLNAKKSFCWTSFDPAVVATRRDARISDRCSSVVGKSLCPVGTDGFHFTIYVAGDGSFFAGRDASVFQYGESVEVLLRAICNGVRPTKISEWIIE
ncbi:SUKH-3 domain-containing protein [Micromonospora sp. NBC_01813]|uniref:SUKH-3 domain-containing protein n=1 Tax=Micromonospora sp. NBC_01813 TaxID=2975988 RepID=UPI002DDC7F8B|nr:SUKH-3 domain-containing protein [Micromonospora sp. NBC_01813]WSA09639.1 SUKH-3 domain-containing protein [Micromonospora sp. NBC_01813]